MEKSIKEAVKQLVDLETFKSNLISLIGQYDRALLELNGNKPSRPVLLSDELKINNVPDRLDYKKYMSSNPENYFVMKIGNFLFHIVRQVFWPVTFILSWLVKDIEDSVAVFFVKSVMLAIGGYFVWGMAYTSKFDISSQATLIFVSILFVLILINAISKSGLFQDSKKKYSEYLDSYANTLAKTNEENDIITKRNEDAKRKYDKELIIYNTTLMEIDKLRTNIYDAKENVTKNIELINQDKDRIYESIGIHSKYRQLDAILKINEYIDTGRVESLFGIEGALNLYEAESRQDKIINLLYSGNNQLSNLSGMFASLVNNISRMQSSISDLRVLASMNQFQSEQNMNKLVEINQSNLIAVEAQTSFQKYALMRNGFKI